MRITKKIGVHSIGWLLFMSLPLAFMYKEPDPLIEWHLLTSGWFWLFVLIFAGVFYLNLLLLVPVFLFRKHYLLYGGALVGLFAVILYTQPFEQLIFQKFHNYSAHGERREFRNPPPNPFGSDGEFKRPDPPQWGREHREVGPKRDSPAIDIVSLVLFGLICALAIAMKFSERWEISEKKMIQSEAAKAHAELSFFKAQIHPHFLFNTLNNLYSMATIQHVNTAPGILKLSNIMRYLIDEASRDVVLLQDEIACISDYIELQKLRLNARTRVDFQVKMDLEKAYIAPLILMTFVENAFKYGVSSHHESIISIVVKLSNGRIYFSCENTVVENERKEDGLGIGIENTKKRLDFSYPNGYHLAIGQNEGRFRVILELTATHR